ncbi:MAG TPA: tetratricopeptide repeat protein [Pyrinomonadaceae bacterium]|nr:tetratricopeptide repeat protein [Chloracidobacterium sp.]MBP9935314.1 tetratricopeptide repeat protein [Pyrinomonadaceae bacterium]MBK7804537.1 tetratricopeptide repeat protein [Chloracidobacterium sp.]MBL0240461.1 tetratricopeptide repeat protein [Chloracidobacterium sp.]HQX57073.1 tetratricopeptide repeat protein [Pyrinomonadaceae bacterium]
MLTCSSRFTGFIALKIGIAILAVIVIVSNAVPPANAQEIDDPAEDAVAIFNQAQELHEQGKIADAIELYKKAIKVFPEFPEAEYQCGTAQLSLGRTAEAEKAFRRAIELRPDWTLPMTNLGTLLLTKGDLAEAENVLSKSIELDDQSFPALAAMAELKLRTKASAAVLSELLTKISALTGKAKPTASLWTARAALENALGRTQNAKASLSNALAIDPSNRFALSELTEIALAEGDTLKASETVALLEKIAPVTVETRLLRARVYAANGNNNDALKTLETLPAPLSAEAAAFRTRLLAATSDNAGELEKQLSATPGDAAILGRLCSLYRVDAPAKALDYCRRASEAEPNNINHVVGLGAALVQAKMYEPAIGLFRKLLTIAPDNSTVHANLGTALFQLKRYAEAKQEYGWLVSKQPDLPIAYFFLAICHDQLAEYLDAMANYQQFLRIADPSKSQLEIDKVQLRIPILQRQINEKKGKK